MSKTPEELHTERKQRILDAAALKRPDRIPIMLPFGYMLARLGGITVHELENDPARSQAILEQAAQRYGADMVGGNAASSVPSTLVGDRTTKWSGKDLPATQPFQYVEGEYMKADEYDSFLNDPSDFAIRTYLPRVFTKLAGLSELPALGMNLYGYYNLRNSTALLNPNVIGALHTLTKVGEFFAQSGAMMVENIKRLAALGCPMGVIGGGALIEAPFDFMSDTLRGMRGIFLDMRRCPEKLLEAENRVAKIMVDYAVALAKKTGRMYATFPLHRGADGFMSLEQFEKFYWPQFKWMLLQLIDAGVTPYVYWEGIWDQRLEYLRELPRAKTIGWFQFGDIFKVKQVLGDTMCIIGGMPNSMLQASSPEQIRAYTRQVCEIMGKNGGFIMAPAIVTMDDCEPDLVQVWVDATKEFGAY
ncbi:MAG TPA: uroporphyrinogen decarboxylase family protein [Anaerolineae bacterium]